MQFLELLENLNYSYYIYINDFLLIFTLLEGVIFWVIRNPLKFINSSKQYVKVVKYATRYIY